MSFVVKVGKCIDPRNKINKTFNTTFELEGTLKDQCDLLNPTIQIRLVADESLYLPNLAKCNYMYIENFGGRYYYITDFKTIRNSMAEITGHVDVLKTYSSEILANTGLILRSQSNYNKLLEDDCFKTFSNDHVVALKFTGDQFTAGTFVLAVSGGGGGTSSTTSTE